MHVNNRLQLLLLTYTTANTLSVTDVTVLNDFLSESLFRNMPEVLWGHGDEPINTFQFILHTSCHAQDV